MIPEQIWILFCVLYDLLSNVFSYNIQHTFSEVRFEHKVDVNKAVSEQVISAHVRWDYISVLLLSLLSLPNSMTNTI